MDIHRHPDLLDRLATAYALGTLRGAARRRFEALARERAPVRAAALIWQSRVASLNELQAPVAAPASVWPRVHNLVQAERERQAMAAARATPTPARRSWWSSLPLWRGAAGAGALATVLAVVTTVGVKNDLGGQVLNLQARLAATPQVAYVAVLNDDSAHPAMLVTFDPQRQTLTLQRVGGYQEAADKSLQLWALPPGGAPRSLGVLGRDPLLHLTAGEGQVRQVPALAISLEPQGGVPGEGGPTGPVLFQGALIEKML